jgi:hypothetical protein
MRRVSTDSPMPRRLPVTRRLSTAARWPVGVLKTGWDYLWRTTPMHRREEPGALPADEPPPLPAGTDLTDLQGIEDGHGALLHRCYVARVAEAERTAAELIRAFAELPDRAAPKALGSFVKLHGDERELRVGDEFIVRIPGPWDGPVRVVEVEPAAFSLATLDGHLEAGRISFSARDLGPGRVEIRIEAWARGGDRISNLLFDRVGVSKEVQLHMWTSVLERLMEMSGGHRDGPLDVVTRRVDEAQLSRAG